MRNTLFILIILAIALNSCDNREKQKRQKVENTPQNIETSSWFSNALEFKGIAVQDDNWQIWGCSPIYSSHVRSLNLANAVSIVVYDGLRIIN